MCVCKYFASYLMASKTVAFWYKSESTHIINSTFCRRGQWKEQSTYIIQSVRIIEFENLFHEKWQDGNTNALYQFENC